MKMNVLVLWGVALGSGLVAMLGVNQLLSRSKVDPNADSASIYVAAEEIPPGIFLEEKHLKKVKWPKANIPEGAIADIKAVEQRVLVAKAFPGDPILKAKLGEKGISGASVTIPKGYRIFTVPVNLTQAHSGMIQPKDRVDVLVTYSIDTATRPLKKCKTVLEYVEVFATDKEREVPQSGSTDDAKSTTKNITLLVTPEQGQLLAMSQTKGELHLALRHVDDKEKLQITDVDETAFDAVKTNISEREPDPIPENLSAMASELASGTLDPKSFLDGLAQAPAAQPVAADTWTITIFEKDQKREEVINVFAEQTTVEAQTSAPQAPGSVLDKVQNWFGPKASRPAAKPVKPVSSKPGTETAQK